MTTSENVAGGQGTNGTNGTNGVHATNGANGINGYNGNGAAHSSPSTTTEHARPSGTCPIAICGMAIRLPGGIENPQQMWDFLVAKRDARSKVPTSRYNIDAYHSTSSKPGTIKTQHGYFLDESMDLRCLDSSCFSIPRGELERVDPHHRQMLEVARECLDDAGEVDWRGSPVGVFMGSFGEDWCEMFAKDSQQYGVYRIGGYGDFMLSNRISYELDLQGPSLTIRTGCSAALIGLHEACLAIERGDCSGAIVGGANLILAPGMTAAMTEQGVLSPDGSCKTFSVDANGYGRAEAINAVYIKPLSAALRDGNPIRAVIRSTASNNDGKTPGISHPSSDAQETLIRRAYSVAGIAPSDVSATAFVECHGTGTAIGDPIETNAIARVFGDSGVYIGSVKPNVGHSEGASGITSLIKAVLALEHKTIPPNIKFNQPNPKIPFADCKLTVPVEPTPWPEHRSERAGVNSFGIGGANVHVIVDSFREYQRTAGLEKPSAAVNGRGTRPLTSEDPQLLVYSANTAQSLGRFTKDVQVYVSKHPEALVDVAYTLANRRETMPYRAFQVVKSGRGDVDTEITLPTSKTSPKTPTIVMVFTGQGAQWPRMGSELLQSNEVFRNTIRELDGCLKALQTARWLNNDSSKKPWSIEEELQKSAKQSRLDRAEFAQPLCTAIQVALVDAFAALGIEASAVVGHSSGEIGAAYAAGALTASEAIVTAWLRGLVVSEEQTATGGMAAIGMGWADVDQYLVPNVVVACDNSPRSVTLSGDSSDLKAVVAEIQKSRPDVLARLLKVDKAYHSHHMVEIGEQYHASISEFLDTGDPRKPSKLFFSSVRGALVDDKQPDTCFDARYWQQNLESPVLFQAAVASILQHDLAQNNHIFLEVGPHSSLAGPLRQIMADSGVTAPYVTSLTRNQDCAVSFLDAVGKLFTLGASVDFKTLIPDGSGATVPDMPRYAWNHEDKFWFESRVSQDWRHRKFAHHDLLGVRQSESSDLEPSWRNILHIQNAEWLRDHRIEDDIVFPCAGYIAMAGEAVRQITGVDEVFTLRHVIISAALVLNEGKPIEFITTLRPHRLMDSQDSRWWEFSIVSYNSHGVWTKHCVGEVTAAQESTRPVGQPVPDLDRHLNKGSYYEFMRKAGNHYGPAFQVMDSIKAGTRTHVATARVPNNKQGDEACYHLHPTIVDAALQLFSMAALNGYTHVNKYSKVVPTKIDSLVIRRFHQDGEIDLKVAATLDRRGDLHGSGECYDVSGTELFKIEGATLSAIDERSESSAAGNSQTPSTARYVWGQHIDFLDGKDLIRPSLDRSLYTPILDELAGLCLAHSSRSLASASTVTPEKLPHLQKFRRWIEQQLQMATARAGGSALRDLGDEEIHARVVKIVDELAGTPAADSAIAMRKVATNITDILSGSVDPLGILMADDTLQKLYTFTDECDRSLFIRSLTHSKPNLRILEIGAGTGASTAHILQDLFVEDDSTGGEKQPLYSKYTFTDISSGFFHSAKERFKEFPNMEYKVLDISKKPTDQDFEERQYDFVIATNVLHATPNLGETLGNVLQLLSSDGRLLLHELSSPSKWVNFVFGTLSGWWCGEADDRIDEPYVSPSRWEAELRSAGFEGLDALVLDSQEPHHLNAIMVAKPNKSTTGAQRTKSQASQDKAVTLLSLPDQRDFSARVSAQLQERGYQVDTCHPDGALPAGRDVISLLDCHHPYLHEVEAKDYESFKRIVGGLVGDAGILWVTGLSQVKCRDPRWAQIIGAARTIRSELMIDFATCEVDDFDRSVGHVIDVFEKFHARRHIAQAAEQTLKPDYEYVVMDGSVHVGRFVPFSLPDETLDAATHDDRLTLHIAKPGRLSSLEWTRRPLPRLEGDEVEVEVYAAGLNFRDVLSALGIVELPAEGFGLEASGIISRVGPDCKEMAVGDRVVVFGRGAFSTHLTASEKVCEKMPDSLSFVDGATMPCVYATAIYTLFNVGGMKKGDTLLIHSACGGVGLAAIQLAKMAGADIFVTVGNEDKAQHLINTFGLPRDRIFNSRNDSFVADVMRETGGKGVDLALNSLSGELLHATWRCIAEFGKMLEIGKRDLLGAAKLDMDVFLANRSYCCVDLDQLCQKKPLVCKSLLQSTMDFYRQGHILPIGPATVFEASTALDAFRYMQQGQHIGKIVISVRDSAGEVEALGACAAGQLKTLKLESAASYLLIGGLGGLGQATSRYMVEHGASRLVYLGRSAGSKPEDQAFARELRSMGCDVVMIRGDVTDKKAVAEALELAPNLKGIVQLSMVLRDQNFASMTMEEWDGAVKAKVQGTWNLHNAVLAAGTTLDFFVLFSSLSGVIGQPGQANYAGANTFLDAFVQYRNQMGLAASSIEIGAVEGIGFIAQNEELLRKMKTSSAYAVGEEELVEAVAAAMMMKPEAGSTTANKTAAFKAQNTFVLGLGANEPLSSPDSRAIWRSDRRMAIYHNSTAGSSQLGGAAGGSSNLKAFLASARADPAKVLTNPDGARVLATEIGRRLFDFLLRPEDDLTSSLATPLSVLGMDSLVAIEMRTWWRQTFGFDLSVLEMLGMGTLEALGKHAAEGLLQLTESRA